MFGSQLYDSVRHSIVRHILSDRHNVHMLHSCANKQLSNVL